MHVLVTGGAGFVGSVLCPAILDRGWSVRIVDSGMFGFDGVDPRAELIKGDVMDFNPNWLEGVDAVVHLAGLSNDPMAEFSPRLNYTLNAAGTARVTEMVKAAGVSRFVFASTCSVYGMSDEAEVDEEAVPKATYPYGISKLMAERAVLQLTDDSFRPIILRKGTVVGWSLRMRFDLVTNTMVKTALTEGRITVNNPLLWRPLLDVKDAAQTYMGALAAPHLLSGIFNVATDNYRLDHLGREVVEALHELGIDVSLVVEHRPEARSYRVSSEKARTLLHFEPELSMKDTVRRIVEGIRAFSITDFNHPRYHNIKQMKLNLASGLVTE